MGQLEWNGADFMQRVEAAAVRGMDRATADGVQAARAKSRVSKSRIIGRRGKPGTQLRMHFGGRYRDGWKAVDAVVQGSSVHGEIINEATNDEGQFYARYVSGGTTRMDGDFAHAEALDTATTRVLGYVREELGL